MSRLVAVCVVLLLLGLPSRAEADLTAFWGLATTPATRTTAGFAGGVTLIIAGFEFEYANAREKISEGAPGLTTGMVNGLVQTPTSGLQFYATAGGGFYRERLGAAQETHFGTNIGGGVKLRLAGPIRLRIDYRVFNLRGSPIIKTPKRLYVGANIAF